jgi:predicted O-methyltransferase YrrM
MNDAALRAHVLADHKMPPRDLISPFGRRLGWYAIARAIKPSVIVETGVERGHGAVILCAALMRNTAEGMPGKYYGTDIDPHAGRLLSGPYAAMGRILYGDSIKSLTAMTETIDLFINDSDHSAEYEYREYHVVAPKLSPRALVLGDNAHVTDKLALFARETGRHFLFFREEPRNHWYPGAGIGISFP